MKDTEDTQNFEFEGNGRKLSNVKLCITNFPGIIGHLKRFAPLDLSPSDAFIELHKN